MAVTVLYPFGQGAAIDGPYCTIAWDGISEPNVSKIPFGIVVEYNNVSYTGTLQASASTMNKVFLVARASNPDVKDTYTTINDNNVFSWLRTGSTLIDMEGYATVEWVESRDVDITEEEYNILVDTEQVDPNKRYFVDED